MTTELTTFEMIKVELRAALEGGDDGALVLATSKLAKFKAEIAKAQAEALKKESEAMAGIRQKMAEKLLGKITQVYPKIADMLAEVKATGFSFYLPDEGSVTSRVGLSVPVIKARKAGGGGGTGKTSKDEFGKSLDEIYQAFKTAEDEAKMAEATTNTKQWQVKTAVKKAALASGALKPLS